jgi:hypothetical protein
MKYRPTALLLILLGCGLAACSKCARTSKPTSMEQLARLLPRSAELVAIIPNVGTLGSKLKRLEQLKAVSFAAQLQGFSGSEELASALMAQLGVDLRSRENLSQAGVDPDQGIAAAVLPGDRAYLVFGVADLDRLRQMLATLAKNRLGAAVVGTREERGQSVTFFSAGDGPQLGFVTKGGFALVGLGESIAELPLYASLAPVDSLGDAPGLSGAVKRLPPGQDVYLYFPLMSSITGQYGLGECTLSAQLGEDALVVRADLPRIQRSLPFVEKGQAPDLLPFLPKETFLIARYQSDPSLLQEILPAVLGSHFVEALEQVRLDLRAEVLQNLKPGMVISLSLAPTAALSSLPELSIQRTNPFRYLHLVALAETRDRTKARATLEWLPRLAPLFGMKIERAERSGNPVYLTSYAQGEGAHLAQVGNRIAVASPVQRLDRVIARLSEAATAVELENSAVRQALDAHPVAAVLDLRQLIEQVKGLPPSAWGVGGFMVKASMLRWLDSLSDLRTLSTGVSSRDGVVQAELQLRFARL